MSAGSRHRLTPAQAQALDFIAVEGGEGVYLREADRRFGAKTINLLCDRGFVKYIPGGCDRLVFTTERGHFYWLNTNRAS